MMEKLKAIAMIGLCLLACWCAFHLAFEQRDDKPEKQQATKGFHRLYQENDSLRKVNRELEYSTRALETKVDSLKTLVTKGEEKLRTLKNRRNERIQAIDTFSGDELLRFFSKQPVRQRQF